MKKIPTFSKVLRKYDEAQKEGKGIEALTELEQHILLHTPMSIFKVPKFRRKLKNQFKT